MSTACPGVLTACIRRWRLPGSDVCNARAPHRYTVRSDLYESVRRKANLRDSTIVELANVHCRTPTGEVLFKDLSFTVHKGENLL